MTRARRAFDGGESDNKDLWNASGDVFGVSGAAGLYSAENGKRHQCTWLFFDEDFFAYKKNVVAWRACLFGWKAMYVSEAIAYHAFSRSIFYEIASLIYFLLKEW